MPSSHCSFQCMGEGVCKHTVSGSSAAQAQLQHHALLAADVHYRMAGFRVRSAFRHELSDTMMALMPAPEHGRW